MTQEEIIALANKAGWDAVNLDDGFGIRLKKFAALVEEKATAIEREACAKVARLFHNPNYGDFLTKNSTESSRNHVALEIEAAIRARGQA